MATVLMLDARNMVSAAFHANWGFTEEHLANFDPGNFKTLLGMIKTTTRYLQEWRPDEIVLMSDRRCTARYEVFPEYKGKRIRDPKIEEHKTDCLQFLRLIFPVRWAEVEGYEADDLMARFAERYHAEHRVVGVTNDRDFVQIIQAFPDVVMYDHVQKRTIEPDMYPYSMVEMKTITGCSGDHIPSVTGEKTALKLMNGEMNLEEYLDAGVTRTEKLPRRVVYERNRKLVSLLGPHALLPAIDHFGFEIGSPLSFDARRALRALNKIFTDDKDFEVVMELVQAWDAWIGERLVRAADLGRVSNKWSKKQDG